MGRRGKKKINKEEISEDWCFRCKDGGSLRICDYGDCLKAYHPHCVGKDDSFLESEVPWTCGWHFCFNCNNTPKFRCFCCPNAICGLCLCDFEFAVIGHKEGLCNHCCMLSGVIEGVENPNPNLGKIDFDDTETYESFFKDYWEIIKQKERLTSVHVRDAVEQLNKCRISKDFADLSGDEDSSQVEDEYRPKSSNDHSNVRKGHKAMNKRKRNRENPSAMKRKVQSKTKEFNGWASNLLSDFLDSIGKDTIGELSQDNVTAIVMQYCNENKLFDPVKRKKVVCDERLKTLLGRNSVRKNSIYNLLTPHFTVNLEQFKDDYKHSSEDEDVSASMSCKRQERSSSNLEPQNKEVINEKEPQNNGLINVDVHRQGPFASMVAQNIKLLYLNRSLIEELLKKPETFEAKVIGSFVRIDSDPFDYLQKNSHMLVKVAGVRKISGNDEVTKEVLLQVSNMPKDVSICQLSNDNFVEEECEDLRQRVKDGRLERPSVMEFKEKARILHEVIKKQWIVKELYCLEKLIDQANPKGWRRELHEYVERKQLLERPSEQSRLLNEFPEIIADETEVDPNDKQYSKKDEQENNISQSESDSRELSKSSTKNSGHDGICSGLNDGADFAEQEQQHQELESAELEQHHMVSSHESNDGGIHQAVINEPVIIQVKENHPETSHPELESGQSMACQSNSGLPEKLKNKQSDPTPEMIEISDNGEDTTIGLSKRTVVTNEPVIIQVKENHPKPVSRQLMACQSNSGIPEKLKNKQTNPTSEMIEISDDEDTTIRLSKQTIDDPDSCIWHCVSPQGHKAGPFSMSLLKELVDDFTHELKFKVWKSGQSSKEAIFLTDAIRLFSHGK